MIYIDFDEFINFDTTSNLMDLIVIEFSKVTTLLFLIMSPYILPRFEFRFEKTIVQQKNNLPAIVEGGQHGNQHLSSARPDVLPVRKNDTCL